MGAKEARLKSCHDKENTCNDTSSIKAANNKRRSGSDEHYRNNGRHPSPANTVTRYRVQEKQRLLSFLSTTEDCNLDHVSWTSEEASLASDASHAVEFEEVFISSACIPSGTMCRHRVYTRRANEMVGRNQYMNGSAIARLLKKHHKKVPDHFKATRF
jgi:hypothetical protein